ncbi:MAG: MMPL family transporter [Thermoplasmataceae archaeon]
MNIAKTLIEKRKIILIIWIVAILAATPALMKYSGYITYSTSSPAGSHSESSIANAILSKNIQENQTLLIAIQTIPYNNTTVASKVLAMQASMQNASIYGFSGTSSPFSAYAAFINDTSGRSSNLIRDLYYTIKNTSILVFSFPNSFYENWSKTGYNQSEIYTVANESGYNSSAYEKQFLNYIYTSYNRSESGLSLVNDAVNNSDYLLFNESPYATSITGYLNVENYTNGTDRVVSSIIKITTGFSVNANIINSVVESSNPGIYYVTHYGLSGIPAYISSQYIARNGTLFLVNIKFNQSTNELTSGGSSVSQNAFPEINKIVCSFFGNSGQVTGEGAIAYQTQQVTSGSGIFFAFIFVILAIAVFLTLLSYKASILTLVVVSIATVLGYVSIFITGILVHDVNYVVNYTLTSVILGVATDYIVFVMSRFKQEIRSGKSRDEAAEIATKKAGKAVFISGLTVAASLGTFYFIPGFRTWGSVLFLAIIMTVVFEVSILPAVMKFLGPKIFMKYGMKPLGKDSHKNSVFYKTSSISIDRKVTVIAVILLLAAPAIYLFATLPTTYNFDTGLPLGLSSVKALNAVDNSFGANEIYPIYFLIPLSNPYNGSFSAQDIKTISSNTGFINNTNGITSVTGPYYNNLSNQADFSHYVVDNGRYLLYLIYTNYGPYSSQALNVVNHLRSDSNALVGGITSGIIDQKAQNSRTYLELEILIVAAIGVILLFAFRSAIYPLISLSGVFISISWTTSILYIISIDILHQALIYLIPVILFVILMSLGNDYTVFIISRIREEVASFGKRDGIIRGMVGSGKVVTSLGLILAASLGSLAFIPVGFLTQLGIAFIISLLLDTFVIRTFYFPAMVALLDGRGKKLKMRNV